MTALQLQRLLDRAGMSQRGAAKALEINERTMRKYCAGDAPVPKTVELAILYLCSQSMADKESDEIYYNPRGHGQFWRAK